MKALAYQQHIPRDCQVDGKTTYDGQPRSSDPPFGASVVVYRRNRTSLEFLVLHRAFNGEGYNGDWAWTPPGGARWPNEPFQACARRELEEETGLKLDVREIAQTSSDWLLYASEAPIEVTIVLDAEHDRYEWLSLEAAASRCQPTRVAKQFWLVACDLA